MDTEGAPRSLSKQELRKQKLMEYLAKKRKLGPPNPKPCLQENAKPRKLTETFVKAPCAARGKKNQNTDPSTQRWKENKTQTPSGFARAPLKAISATNIAHHNTTQHAGCSDITVHTTCAPLDKMCCDIVGLSDLQPSTVVPGSTVTCTSHSTIVGPAGSCHSKAARELRHPSTASIAVGSRPRAAGGTANSRAPGSRPGAAAGGTAASRAPGSRPGAAAGDTAASRAPGSRPRAAAGGVAASHVPGSRPRAAAGVAVGSCGPGSQPGATSTGPFSSNSQRAPHSNTVVSGNSWARTATSVRASLTRPSPRTVSCGGMAAKAASFKSNLSPPSRMQSKSNIISASCESLSGTQVKVIPAERQRNPSSTMTAAKSYSRYYRAQANRASDLTGTKDASYNPVPFRCRQNDSATLAPLSTPKLSTSHQAAGPQLTKDQAPSRARASALHRAVFQAMAKTDKETSQQALSRFDGPEMNSRVPKTVVNSEYKGSMEFLPPTFQSQANCGGLATMPRNGQRKMTAAQEERMRKLQEWREAKGITYKRPAMPIRPNVKKQPPVPKHYWNTMETEDEVQHLVCTIDSALADCLKLVQEGYPAEQVTALLSRLPVAQKFAKYWICQARLMERAGNLEVLPLFEQAVQVVLEPVDELRDVIFEILKKTEEACNQSSGEGKIAPASEPEAQTNIQEVEDHEISETNLVTPKATSVLIRGAKEGSSVVKYKITATPGKSQKQQPMYLDGQELRFFTPVRRSVRIERSTPRYPAALQEHDPCVASFRDLLAEKQTEVGSLLYVYRENEALGDQVQLEAV